jgi:hypothetical protein
MHSILKLSLYGLFTFYLFVSAQNDMTFFEPEVLVKLDSDYLIYAFPTTPQLVNGHVLASLNFMADRLRLKVVHQTCTAFTVESPSKTLEFTLGNPVHMLTNKTTGTVTELKGKASASPYDFNTTRVSGDSLNSYCDVLISVTILAEAFNLSTTWDNEYKTLFVDSTTLFNKGDYFPGDDPDIQTQNNTGYAFPQTPNLAPDVRINNLKFSGDFGDIAFNAKRLSSSNDIYPLYYVTYLNGDYGNYTLNGGAASNAVGIGDEPSENGCKKVGVQFDCLLVIGSLATQTINAGSTETLTYDSVVQYIWFGFY